MMPRKGSLVGILVVVMIDSESSVVLAMYVDQCGKEKRRQDEVQQYLRLARYTSTWLNGE